MIAALIIGGIVGVILSQGFAAYWLIRYADRCPHVSTHHVGYGEKRSLRCTLDTEHSGPHRIKYRSEYNVIGTEVWLPREDDNASL